MTKTAPPAKAQGYALCIHAGEYENVDLIQRKVYDVWPDPAAERHGQIRVVDESGEDYLFPAEYFQLLTLPVGVARVFERDHPRTRARSRRNWPKTRR